MPIFLFKFRVVTGETERLESVSYCRHGRCEEKIDELLEGDSEAGKLKNPNKIFFGAVGGWKQGVVPGLGSYACILYEKPTSRCGKSNSQYVPSEIASVHAPMKECERLLQEQRARQKEMRAQLEEDRKLILDMSRQLQIMSQAV